MCFNPRTHTGCDFNKTIVLQNSIVSIHAPTRGATRPKGSDLMLRGVSIHAPTRGATSGKSERRCLMWFQSTHPHGVRRCLWRIAGSSRCFNPRTHTGCDSTEDRRTYGLRPSFNPRTHTGCDPNHASGHPWLHDVSIHAPTRGAT